MNDFRHMLSPKEKYCWMQDLEEAFVLAKKTIVARVQEGIAMFNTSKITVLNTNWSKVGILMAIMQKHCECKQVCIRCCSNGWFKVLQ